MRILHLTDDVSAEASGVSSYLRSLLTLLQAENVEVSLFSPPATGSRFESLLSRWGSYRYYRQVRRLLSDERPTVVHAHNLSLRLSPLVLRAACEASVPVVATAHDFNSVCPRKWLQRTEARVCPTGFTAGCLVRNCPTVRSGWRYLPYQDARWLKTAIHRRMLSRWVQLFICPTAVLADYMQKAFKNSAVVCLPNFAMPFPHLTAAWEVANRMLFVGRLSKDKGVDVLIRAMPIILASCPEARLTVVGDGPESNPLRQLAARLGVSRQIQFCGLVKHSALADYYEKSTVCVLPSSWMENCPISGLEALAAGRPLVGTDIGGIPEIVMDTETGFLVRVGDVEALARTILRLLGDRDLVRSFGERAKRLFEQKFSPEIHIGRLIDLYTSVTVGLGQTPSRN